MSHQFGNKHGGRGGYQGGHYNTFGGRQGQNQQGNPKPQEQGKWTVPTKAGEASVLVTQVVTPLICFCQDIERDAEKIMSLQNDLEQVCPTGTSISGTPDKKKTYASKYSLDDKWYRCRVLEILEGEKCKVQYVDYGNNEEVEISSLVELPQSLSSIKWLANMYFLYGLKKIFGEATSGFEQGKQKLTELTLDKQLKGEIYTAGRERYIILNDTETNVDINQEMLNAGFGERRFYTAKSFGKPQRNQGYGGDYAQKNDQQKDPNRFQQKQFHNFGGSGDFQGKGERPSRQFPRNQDSSFGSDRQALSPPLMNNQFTQPPPSMQTPFMNSQIPPPHIAQNKQQRRPGQQQSFSGNKGPHMGSGTGINDETLMAEISQLRLKQAQLESENRRLRQKLEVGGNSSTMEADRDHKVLELAEARTQIKRMQEEVLKIREAAKEHDINNQISSLLNDVTKVKLLRLQFPTNSGAQDNIQAAIDLVSDSEQKIDTELSVTYHVSEALTLYNQAQETIQRCSDKSILNGLIATRNQAKSDLYNTINTFLKQVEHLPLADRSAELQNCIIGLETTHFKFLHSGGQRKSEPLGDTLMKYKAWRDSKASKFEEVRTSTNTKHNAVSSALGMLRKQLALDLRATSEHTAATDLNVLLSKFEKDLSKEISETDIEKSDDAKLVSQTLASLMNELKTELQSITKLHQHVEEYAQLKDSLEQWLEQKPELSELKTVRSNVKTLKSQLRHKLADKQDIEESDDSDGEGLTRVKSELQEIRCNMHVLFQREDEILAHLADLAEHHFPELPLQYPDLGIENEIEFSGLVKLGRSLDQFTTAPLVEGCGRSGVLRAQYGSKDVVFKEYIIGESLGIKKDHFLDRAMKYYPVYSDNLLNVQGIFFHKDDRHAYVQLPHYQECLGSKDAQAVKHMSHQARYLLIKGVLEGLNALHNKNLIHGSIHPNNVFIKDDAEGVLADYNFARSINQRAERIYTTNNGIKFLAPEAQQSVITKESDMYCLGLLILYIYDPVTQVERIPPPAPPSGMESVMQGIVQNLLQASPAERYTAVELLNESYFNEMPQEDSSLPRETTLQLRPKSPVQAKDTNSSSKLGILKSGTAYPDQETENVAENGEVIADDSSDISPKSGTIEEEFSNTAGVTQQSDSTTEVQQFESLQPVEQDLTKVDQTEAESLEENSAQNSETTGFQNIESLFSKTDLSSSQSESSSQRLEDTGSEGLSGGENVSAFSHTAAPNVFSANVAEDSDDAWSQSDHDSAVEDEKEQSMDQFDEQQVTGEGLSDSQDPPPLELDEEKGIDMNDQVLEDAETQEEKPSSNGPEAPVLDRVDQEQSEVGKENTNDGLSVEDIQSMIEQYGKNSASPDVESSEAADNEG